MVWQLTTAPGSSREIQAAHSTSQQLQAARSLGAQPWRTSLTHLLHAHPEGSEREVCALTRPLRRQVHPRTGPRLSQHEPLLILRFVVRLPPAAPPLKSKGELTSPRRGPPHSNSKQLIPYHTTPYRTIPYHTVPYRTVPYHQVRYDAATIK